MMKKTLLFTVAALVLTTQAMALPRDGKRLRQTAMQVLNTGKQTADAEPRLLQATDAYTIFGSDAGGYVMLSNDDRLPEVLARCDGRFNPKSQNPGFRWYCEAVSRVAQEVQEASNAPAETTKPNPDKFPTQAGPLLQTHWGQGEPYFYWCPSAYGEIMDEYTPSEWHCAVGCVATAMAQIVKYWRWPEGASGKSIIFWGDDNEHPTDSIPFSGTYDYDLMLDSYRDVDYTAEQGEAVALLSWHCGLISHMGYAYDGSGTANQMGVKGLQEYFGYSQDARIVVRNEFSESEWMEMVYTELSEGRPLYYQGVVFDISQLPPVIGGHSFVIDGYDENGLVHVNWGWYGDDDGYYDIAVLDPRNYHFDAYQDMVIGLKPDREGGTNAVGSIVADTSMGNPQYVYRVDGTRTILKSLSKGELYISNGKKYLKQ